MFEPDKYPGLDDYYESKHRDVLVERGEVIMYLHCLIFILWLVERSNKIVRLFF